MAQLQAINFGALALFSTLVLVIAVFGLSLSGHFPAEHRKPGMQGPLGRLILVGCIITVALSASIAIGLALGRLPPPAAIIGGGLALLAAPLVLQRLPDAFVDGRRGLLTLAALAAALAWLANQIKS